MWRFVSELVSLLILFLLIRSVAVTIWRLLRGGMSVPNPSFRDPNPDHAPLRSSGELHRDPVCNTFVAAQTAYTAEHDGATVYFCSPECRDQFERLNRGDRQWEKRTAVRT